MISERWARLFFCYYFPMLEPPPIPGEALLARLRADFGIAAESSTFLPLGNDASAWVFRVRARDGARYFLKVKAGGVYEAGLWIPRWLHEHGIQEVVAPIPARSGALWSALEEYTLLLYPFIEGRTGMAGGLTAAQWAAFGALLRRVHQAQLPPEQVPVEDFRPPWAERVRALDAQIAREPFSDAHQQALADFWTARRGEILEMVEHAETLGRRLRANPPARVLCHSDIHTANLLLDPSGGLHIIDWDDPKLAPVERDLMFIPGGVEGAWFTQGYGTVEINPLALAYYRCEWVVQEVGDDGQRVLSMPELGERTRAASVEDFIQLFAPGDVVAAAQEALLSLS